MSKFISAVLSIYFVVAVSGCSFFPDNSQKPQVPEQTQERPFTNGPTEGPETMKGPDQPPLTTKPATEEELARIERTHQEVVTKYSDKNGEHEITFIFNIDENTIKGISFQPSIKDESEREKYHQLTTQAVFKTISELNVQPVDGIPELSQTFIDALNQAIQMYRDKNPQA